MSKMSMFTFTALILVVGAVFGSDMDPRFPDRLYKFGPAVGDTAVAPKFDDFSYGPFLIDGGFPFFTTSRQSFYMNSNGMMSFDASDSRLIPAPFPEFSRGIIALFWNDIDIRNGGGDIFYRTVTEETTVNCVKQEINSLFASKLHVQFCPTWVFIVTWYEAARYGNSAQRNTFQAVLATDGKSSFVNLNYGVLTYRPGSQAGFNDGDGVRFFTLDKAMTGAAIEIADGSNFGQTGRYWYRVSTNPGPNSGQICQPDRR